jgi:hypothetical protein
MFYGCEEREIQLIDGDDHLVNPANVTKDALLH